CPLSYARSNTHLNSFPTRRSSDLFAQHYAESRGNPSESSWNEIIETYGEAKALGILGAIRMITFGNSFGIALSAFRSRLKGKTIDRKSTRLNSSHVSISYAVFCLK